ncbi:MAG: hypothetical protein CJBNEKGG_01626 [Prosthecobacter sp.]|nr:hypothetical protein [Prosthecobacter sp.]
MRLTSIFFDLDETLIHSVLAEEGGGECPAGATVFGPYHSWMRPCAFDLLKAARSIGVPTFLCTTSERRYASGLSKLFDLGFAENEILGYEHLTSGQTGLAPGAVLIDDMEPGHEIAQFKRQVLGIGTERYCQLPAFRGRPPGDENAVIQSLNAFLRPFRNAR